MAAAAASIAVFASEPAFCAAARIENSIVAALANANIFFMLIRISFLPARRI
jgi:hypothetical protein